jgi:hypothetical protein
VCSITHGAIFTALAGDAGKLPRGEAIAPMASAAAATKNNKQKTRRLLDDVNVNVRLGFVFIKGCGFTSIHWDFRKSVNSIFNAFTHFEKMDRRSFGDINTRQPASRTSAL